MNHTKRVVKFSAQILLLFVFLASFFLLFTKTTLAQTSTTTNAGTATNNARFAPILNPDVPQDQHTYVQTVIIEILSAGICQITGVDPIRTDHRCLGVDTKTNKIGFVEQGGGALGVMGTLITYTFTPPVSSGDYVRYLAGNFGISHKTYAQGASDCAGAGGNTGIGFCGITPLMSIWVAMRNIAYLLFVIIFVIIGVAIMLRVHIDPRTVMSIENQIPKIIVGILLVTFSFALAGFLIDVMYIAIYLVGLVLVDAAPNNPGVGSLYGVPFRDIATAATPFDMINTLWEGGFAQLSAQGGFTIGQLIDNVLHVHTNPNPGLFDIFSNTVGFVAGIIVGLLAFFIIALALIYTAIRLWIILVVAYINILLDIVFAPFWFLVGLFPGSTAGVGAWFKDMLANLAVFPTAIAMFILGKIFSEVGGTTGTNLFVPPLVGGGTGAGSDVFAGIVALGFLFMTPHVLQITRSAIKAPNVNYGPVFDPVGQAGGTVGSAISTGAAMNARIPLPGQKGGRDALARRLFKF